MQKDSFLQQIKRVFPKLKWDKHRIITHGWDYHIIVLDEKIIFRFPKEDEYKHILKNEIGLLNYLRKKIAIKIPEYIYIAPNKEFVGYKILQGQELTYSEFNNLTELEKRELVKQLSNFLTVLHTVAIPDISQYNIVTENYLKECKNFTLSIEKILFPQLNKNEVFVVKNFLSELGAISYNNNYQYSLIHNDLTKNHILWDNKNKKLGIIDFSDCAFGDPALDFAGLWEYGEPFVKEIYTLYKGRKDNKLLYRSQIYFKRIPLSIMKGALSGSPGSFQEGYEMFKKRHMF